MTHRTLIALLTATVLLSAPIAHACARTSDAQALEAETIRLVNVVRRDKGLAPVRAAAGLERSAQGHACDIAARQTTSHVSANGGTLKTRLNRSGYRPRVASENTGRGFTSPAQAVHWWMTSPPHRANILMASVREIGVGLAVSEAPDTRLHWVVNFGVSR